ncbi:ABC transporter transmembrane region/ABC transporter [Novymonas esmeraldas]|uniref:ABC transporter transmembrane region/ABC transporter n=1 Tax=Novymonas esmeraldas TaxID=1808958 RepID=A0AAW0ENJ0_9TRYP
MASSPGRQSSSATWALAGVVGAGDHSGRETSPLLPRAASGASLSRSTQRPASPRPATSRGVSSAAGSDASATTTSSTRRAAPSAAASSLSVNDSSRGGGSTFARGGSCDGGRSDGDGRSRSNSSGRGGGGGGGGGSDGMASGGGGGGGGVFGAPPTSPSEFLAVVAHAVALQSWTSWLLAVGFHLFHMLLIISFLTSPILVRSTVFSPQTMAKSLLEAQGVIQRKGNGSGGGGGGGGGAATSAPAHTSSVSLAPVSVESVWAIHDAVFFLEPGHVVAPANISDSFASLRRKGRHGADTRVTPPPPPSAGSSAVGGRSGGAGAGGAGREHTAGKSGGDPHTYIVPHQPGDGGGNERAAAQMARASAGLLVELGATAGLVDESGADAHAGVQQRSVVLWDSNEGDRGAAVGDGGGGGRVAGVAGALVPLRVFAPPPPVAPEYSLSGRKSATHGRVTLSKIVDAWEASPLYSSPLALTLFYYLYGVGCVILLLTVTDGMLTGHFSILRLGVALAELLWYIHHGSHAFVIYCWLLLLSHWPHHAMRSPADAAFLQRGTPYAVVEKRTGELTMFWFDRVAATATAAAEAAGGGERVIPGRLLTAEIDLAYYLYDQVWYLKPLAEAVAVFHLCLLSLCLVKDVHRLLDAVVGVRELMEPEGCVRCPLCGALLEVCEQRSLMRRNSIYESARDRASWSVRRTRWWWRWLRSAVRGSSSGHRVPTPRLPSAVWRWLVPSWCGGGPRQAPHEAAAEHATDGHVTVAAFVNDEAPYTLADMLEDVEFYEQSAVRRSAAAPQDTTTEETAHLMRWLTTVPHHAGRSSAVRVRGGDRSRSRTRNGGGGTSSSSAEDEEEDEEEENAEAAASALALGSSASSSSSEDVEAGLVKSVPATATTSATAARPGGSGSGSGSGSGVANLLRAAPPASATAEAASPTRSAASSTSASPTRRRRRLSRQRSRQRSRRRSQGRALSAPGSTAAPLPAHLQRRTRFTEEVLYWNYATRHVHHRCPKLYLDAAEASDDEDEDDEDEDEDDEDDSDSESSESSSEASSPEGSRGTTTPSPGSPTSSSRRRQPQRRRVSDTPVEAATTATTTTTTAAARARAGGVMSTTTSAADRANVGLRGLRRSLSPRAGVGARAAEEAPPRSARSPTSPADGVRSVERRRQSQAQARRDGASGGSPTSRSYGTFGPNFSESPSHLFARVPPPQSGANHIVQRGVYDPTKDGEDEFRPGNAFRSYDRAGWVSRLTYSWLNPLLTFALLEPTLLRQERFLPSLPEALLSLDNIAVPAWRLWVHRRVWFAGYVAKPGELLIPSNEAMLRAEEEAMSLADLHEVDLGEDGDETESSEGRQTVVMLGHTSLRQAAKFRPQRPRRCWQESLAWAVSAPLRYLLVHLFYYTYLGTSRTVRRTRRRLVRELLKDRLAAAAEDLCDSDGYHAMEASEAMEEATWALAEMASSCGSSAAAPSAGSALPTHMRRQLALSDVSLFHVFMEHRCGRRFLLMAAPLLLLSELLTVAVVPAFDLFTLLLQRVDFDVLPHRRESSSEQGYVTASLLCAAVLGVLLLVQGVVHGAYVSQVQQAAMEARTSVRAMVLEKTLVLPLAQRTFTEAEVVTLATEEAVRVATCLVSLHHTWSCPLRVALLSLLLSYYVGWTAAGVAGVGSLLTVPLLRHASHEVRQSRHQAREATAPRIALLQRTMGHIREVKAMLLEGRLARRLRKARAAEAACAEAVAMAEGTSNMLAGGVACLLMVAALGAEYIASEQPLHDMDVLVPVLVIFVLLTVPLLELPALFTVVARGFLSMKRIEAYLRQTPDEFTGTWVDLTSFTAMQQQLRSENPSSALLHYRRGSVVCRESSFTWQHDLTEELPATLLRDVDVCIEPGQLVVVQGSMGTGKSTLLLSVLGEVNRCVSATAGASSRASVADCESESTLSVVSATEAAALAAAYATGSPATAVDQLARPRRHPAAAAGAAAASRAAVVLPTGPSSGEPVLTDAVGAPGIFIASPTESADARRRFSAAREREAGVADGGAAAAVAAAPVVAASASAPSSGTAHGGGVRGVLPRTALGSFAGDRASVGSATTATASQRHPVGLESDTSSTGGFLVFGSCAYCAEVPWLQNDTVRANIMSSGGPVQLERWYYTVLRACALDAELAALPHGDATVIGERGELLSLSMRCRIAIARAVYSKSHVYLMDSVLSPLEPLVQEHIIREVFHKLLRKKTVIVASNVGLRSLRPHRVFSVVDGGVVREDTDLYKAVSSLNARSDDDDDDDEDAEGDGAAAAGATAVAAAAGDRSGGADDDGSGDSASSRRGSSDSSRGRSCSTSSDGGTSQATAPPLPPLPPLYAEEFEEPQEFVEPLAAMETFADDPTVAAATLLFDGDVDLGSLDALLHGDLDGGGGGGGGVAAGGEVSGVTSALLGWTSASLSSSAALRPRRSGCLSPSTSRRIDAGRSGATSGTATPGLVALPPAVVPMPTSSGKWQSSTFSGDVAMTLPAGVGAASSHGSDRGADDASAGKRSNSTCSTAQYIRNHYAQQLQRERVLRHRHRLSFFIFLRFMGGQVVWLLLTVLLQHGVSLAIEVWAAVWLAVMATHESRSSAATTKTKTTATSATSNSLTSRVSRQLYVWATTDDAVFLGVVSALCAVAMVLTLFRARSVYVGVYGTMHFIYGQIVQRVLHAPASYFDSRIIALLTRVLRSDGEVAEHRVPATAEVLLSCSAQLALVAVWGVVANPIFVLLLPMAVSLFYHISQRHTVVLREVRRLELGSVGGMADILREVYQGASTVRSMALQDRLREEFCRALDTVNTASMVAYLADRWVELRLHVLTTLAVCATAAIGVVFTFSYSRPSYTAVAMAAFLRAGPVLVDMCRSLGVFAVTEWLSVQRLMSLWSVPQEPLTLVGDADLYTYSHVRRNATGAYVELEGGNDAPLLNIVGTPTSSPRTQRAMAAQRRDARRQAKAERRRQLTETSGDGAHATTSLSQFAADSLSSSSSADLATAAGAPGASCSITLPQLELRNVSARYRTTLPYVLRHVNLAVYPGERLGVVGHAGQGKGSLFNVLLRLVDVIEGGGVFVDGEDAARVPYPILRGWFGLVPQEPMLVQGSWRSNLLLGYHPEHRMLIDGANGGAERPYLPITTMPRQPPPPPSQAHPTAAAAAAAPTAGAAARRSAESEERPRLLTPSSARPAALCPDDSIGSASLASNSYGSTDSAQQYMQDVGGGDRPRLRFMDSADDLPITREEKRDGPGGGVAAIAGAVARRLRDSVLPSRRRPSRGPNTAQRQHTPPSRTGSSGGGGSGLRRRRRSGRGAGSGEGGPHHPAGRVVEGPRQPVEDAALWAALRAVGLDAAVEFDGGLDAPLVGGDLTESGVTESQCRLLCLARAVLNRPQIVLLEDAVHSGAEAQTDRAIQRVLANELRGSTVLIIAHRMPTVLTLCTRVVAMQGGALVPIADLEPTLASPVAPDASGAADGLVTATPTPPATPTLDPAVMRRLSYYVE